MCTVNDLLIAAVTAGLRELLSERGEYQEGLALRASVPVGARAGGGEGRMFIAPLPVGVSDETERLRIITQATAAGKARPDQGVAGIVAVPASLARLGVAWAKRSAIPTPHRARRVCTRSRPAGTEARPETG